MLDPLLIMELVPLLLSGAAMVGAAAYAWFRAPRTALSVTLILLLVFLGHLSLAGALLALPNDDGLALRLFPLFQLAVTGSVLAFLVFLFEPHLEPRRLDALLSSIVFGGLLLVGLVIWRPDFYWGTEGPGPLVALDGIRAAAFALAAWLLAARGLGASRRFPQIPRSNALLLSAGFLFVAVHGTVRATMGSLLAGRPEPEAGFLAAPFVLGLFLHLAVLARGREEVRAHLAARYLLAALVPAIFSVIMVDLIVFQVLPQTGAGTIIDVVLEHFWMVALAAGTVWSTRTGRPLGRPLTQGRRLDDVAATRS